MTSAIQLLQYNLIRLQMFMHIDCCSFNICCLAMISKVKLLTIFVLSILVKCLVYKYWPVVVQSH